MNNSFQKKKKKKIKIKWKCIITIIINYYYITKKLFS